MMRNHSSLIISLFMSLSISCSRELDDITDPEILDAPLQFEVYAEFDSQHLSWIDNSNSEAGYVLERITPASYDTLAILPPNSVQFIDSTFFSDTTHAIEYRLYAFKKNFRSAVRTVSFTPGGFNAPSELNMDPISGLAVILSWRDRSTMEEGFIVERKEDNGDFRAISVLDINSTSFTDSDIEQGKVYTYRVAAKFKNEIILYSEQLTIKYGFEVESSVTLPNASSYNRTVRLIPNSERLLVYSGDPSWPELTDHVNVYSFNGDKIYEIPERQSTSAVSPEGNLIATTRTSSDIHIWDAASGTLIQKIKRLNPELPPRAIAVSQLQNMVAIFELSKDYPMGYLRVHNLTDGSLIWQKEYGYLWHIVLQFTDKGKLIYTTENRLLRMVNPTTDSLIYAFNVREAISVNLSKDENFAAVATTADEYNGTTGDLYLWDLAGRYLKKKMMDIDPFDAIFIETGEPEIRCARKVDGGWKIFEGLIESPILMLGVQNLILIPGHDMAVGYGISSSVQVFQLKKEWYTDQKP